MNYPLCSSSWDSDEVESACSVIRTGQCTMGSITKQFEHEFAKYVGSKFAVMVNSGSSANLLAVASQFYITNPLKRDDEVLVPALGWSTTYFPLVQYGLKLRLIDIELDTLNIDSNKLKLSINQRTRAAMIVNVLGNPCSSEIKKICKEHELIMMEDSCESLGAIRDGQQCGTFGKVGTFSFFFSHHICTMEGGMVVTDDEETYQIMLSLRAHGWTRDLPERNLVCDKTGDEWNDRYCFATLGYNLRPTDVQAAIGLSQLKKLDNIVKLRRSNADYFKQRLAEFNFDRKFLIGLGTQHQTGKSSYYAFPLILGLDFPGSRDNLVRMLTERGIESRPIMTGAFHLHPVADLIDLQIGEGELEIAEYVDRQGLMIGNGPRNMTEEINYLFSVLNEYCVGKTKNLSKGEVSGNSQIGS
jgi:CDP-6-deoxy-D-xylo-4-hexulose-3-dehydrase